MALLLLNIIILCTACGHDYKKKGEKEQRLMKKAYPGIAMHKVPLHFRDQADSLIKTAMCKSSLEMPYTGYKMKDLNYDGVNDLIINFTGIRSIVLSDVYIIKEQDYTYDTLLSGVVNLSFFKNLKIITGYNIGPNSGDAVKLLWNNKDKYWYISETMEFEPTNERGTWWRVSIYNNKGELIRKTKSKNFRMPDPDLLPVN